MLLWSNRIRAIDYYEQGLFDQNISITFKRKYIGQYQTRHLFYMINARDFHYITDEKLRFSELAAEAKLPIPEILAVVTNQGGDREVPVIRTERELQSWMARSETKDIVLKPVDGLRGWGVLSLSSIAGEHLRWRRLPGEDLIDTPAIWRHCERYLYRGGVMIQRRLQPQAVVARFMPDVLHTVRAITYSKPEPHIVDAILRVGSGKGPTDNISQGGIAIPIDLATGQCGRGSMLVNGVPQFVDDHPRSGTRMTGAFLPDWDQVCELAQSAARVFETQVTIGWDIGLTTRGPVLLEGNWCYGLRANQLANRKGILSTPWVKILENEGASRLLGLGFGRRPQT